MDDIVYFELFQTTTKGFTGHIEFDDEGKRVNFRLHYSKLNTESKFMYAGDWDFKTNAISHQKDIDDRSLAANTNSKLRVTVTCALKFCPPLIISSINVDDNVHFHLGSDQNRKTIF